MPYTPKNITQYILIFICLISIIGAAVYRVYALNNLGIFISLSLSIITFIILHRFRSKYNQQPTTIVRQSRDNHKSAPKQKIVYYLLFTIYCLLFIGCIYILISCQTAAAIISPWQVLPNYFFILYILLTAVLLLIITKRASNKAIKPYNHITTIILILHYLLSFSIAIIIYKLGFGFDPFVHRATVDLIDKTGAVEPKPLYYLGQYALLIILNKITFIPLLWLDKLLVPILAGIFLPLTLLKVLNQWLKHKTAVALTVMALLAIPFSFFIVTTPQNLAYLFLLLAILLGLACKNTFHLIIIYLLALAACVTQPIAGIPALLFAIVLTTYHSDRKKIKKYLYGAVFLLSSTALPLALWFVNRGLRGFGAQGTGADHGAASSLWPVVPGQENFILNFIYLYAFNLKTLIALLVIAGAIIAYRHRRQCRILGVYLIISTALWLSYFLAKLLPFDFLIDYERSNYSDRIMLIAAFFMLPFILLAFYGFINKLNKQNKLIKISFTVFAILLITTSIYLSYPRFDHYHNSRGYSVSNSDIKAVRWIESNTKNDNYIVLANQQVSAAALSQFGFKKYYETADSRMFELGVPPAKSLPSKTAGASPRRDIGAPTEIFYYPIPTGGPLYQYYLDMVYEKPTRGTMLNAMDLAGVNEAYFVLNKYWWAFPKILAEAKLEADSWEEIDNGKVYVLKYKKHTDH